MFGFITDPINRLIAAVKRSIKRIILLIFLMFVVSPMIVWMGIPIVKRMIEETKKR